MSDDDVHGDHLAAAMKHLTMNGYNKSRKTINHIHLQAKLLRRKLKHCRSENIRLTKEVKMVKKTLEKNRLMKEELSILTHKVGLMESSLDLMNKEKEELQTHLQQQQSYIDSELYPTVLFEELSGIAQDL